MRYYAGLPEPNPAVVILSAERAEYDAKANAGRTLSLKHALQAAGFAFDAARGMWEGKSERSFVVTLSSRDAQATVDFGILTRLALKYGQDAILFISPERRAALFFAPEFTGGGQNLGKLLASPTRPDHVPGYTYVHSKRTYYYTVPGAASEPEPVPFDRHTQAAPLAIPRRPCRRCGCYHTAGDCPLSNVPTLKR